jgi:hypothetical protein
MLANKVSSSCRVARSSLLKRPPIFAARSISGSATRQPPSTTLGGVSSTSSRNTSAMTSSRSAYTSSRSGILARELRDLFLRPARADSEVSPVLRRQEVRDLALDDLQSMRMQIEIANDLRVQQRNRVRRNRVAESRMEFLRDCRAADDVTSFEHRHLQTSRCEIRSADQAVVAATDDQNITGCRHDAPSSNHGA